MSSSSTSAGGSPRNGASRSSGGHHGMPSARVDRLLVGRVGQRLERRDVLGRARRAEQRGPEALRLGDDELDRHALDRHPDRAPLVPLDHGDDLRQRREAREHGSGIRRGADDRELLARVAPAAHVAGRLAAERARRSPPTSSRARLSSSPRRGRGSASRASASSSCASVFGPIPGHVAQPAGGAPPRGARRRCARRAPARSRPSASRRARGSGRGRRDPGASSRSSSASSAISPVSTSSRSRASIPGPIPRSSRTRPGRTSSATGIGAPRIVSAARRYARAVYGFASASSSSDANASRRSAIWAFSTGTVSPQWSSPRAHAARPGGRPGRVTEV